LLKYFCLRFLIQESNSLRLGHFVFIAAVENQKAENAPAKGAEYANMPTVHDILRQSGFSDDQIAPAPDTEKRSERIQSPAEPSRA
jgi:hypothetical protein